MKIALMTHSMIHCWVINYFYGRWIRMSEWLMFGVVSWFLSLPPPLENGEKKLEIYVRDLDATIIERETPSQKKNQKEKDQNRWLISKPREFEFEELKSGKKWLPWQKFFENFKHEFPGRWLVRQFFGSACFFCVLMSKLPINNGQLFYNYLFVSQLVSSRFVRLCPPIIDGPRAYDRPSTVKKIIKFMVRKLCPRVFGF